MNRAERLAGHVVSNRVNLEAGCRPESRSCDAGLARALGREDRAKERNPWPDENDEFVVDFLLQPLEAERI